MILFNRSLTPQLQSLLLSWLYFITFNLFRSHVNFLVTFHRDLFHRHLPVITRARHQPSTFHALVPHVNDRFAPMVESHSPHPEESPCLTVTEQFADRLYFHSVMTLESFDHLEYPNLSTIPALLSPVCSTVVSPTSRVVTDLSACHRWYPCYWLVSLVSLAAITLNNHRNHWSRKGSVAIISMVILTPSSIFTHLFHSWLVTSRISDSHVIRLSRSFHLDRWFVSLVRFCSIRYSTIFERGHGQPGFIKVHQGCISEWNRVSRTGESICFIVGITGRHSKLVTRRTRSSAFLITRLIVVSFAILSSHRVRT